MGELAGSCQASIWSTFGGGTRSNSATRPWGIGRNHGSPSTAAGVIKLLDGIFRTGSVAGLKEGGRSPTSHGRGDGRNGVSPNGRTLPKSRSKSGTVMPPATPAINEGAATWSYQYVRAYAVHCT
jgi:hypothetical protein